MIVSRFLRVIGMVLAAVTARSAATAVENPRCVYPDPYTLLGRNVPGLDRIQYLIFDTEAGRMRWAFISWEDQQQGMVFLLACDGHVVDKRELGYIREFDYGPMVNNRLTVDVRYPSAIGMGTLVESESLLQFDGKAIAVLWTHDRSTMSAAPNSVRLGKPGDDRMRREADSYRWSFVPTLNMIEVTGTRDVTLGGETKSTLLPQENYCFRADANRFVRC